MLKFSRKASSILEQSLLITTVIAGIIVMTRYVTYSVNAHFKTWEDAVEDATEDKLVKFDVNSVGGLPTASCACAVNYTQIGCGTGSCSGTQMYYKRYCAPVGCPCTNIPPSAPFSGTCDECVTDNSCCVNSPTGACGTGGCGAFERPNTQTCGGNPPVVTCVPDPGSCGPFVCEGTPVENATLCAGDDTGVLPNTYYQTVDACTQEKCEYVCNAGFIRRGSICEPPPSGPCGPGKVQCWSCGASMMYADVAACCAGLTTTGICGCSPAPPSCWSCGGMSGFGLSYSNIGAACSAAEADATSGCPHSGKPQCGWWQGWSGGYTTVSNCGCTFTCEDSCTN